MLNSSQAAKILSDEYTAAGYNCRYVPNMPHPKFYLESGGIERFTILSSSENYDTGNILQIKRQDIRRDIIPYLPLPVSPKKKKHEKKTLADLETELKKATDNRVYSVTVYLFGAAAMFSINMPAELIPPLEPRAKLFVTEKGRVGIRFGLEGRQSSKIARTDSHRRFSFTRNEVPFTYAKKSPGIPTPKMVIRPVGKTFVFDEVLPKQLTTYVDTDPLKLTKPSSLPTFTLERGAELVRMFNEWLTWAKAEGHNPSINDDRVASTLNVTIEERTTRKL